MTAPNRRWFRFSLRTLFVVMTVFCWLGYQINWMLQRHEALSTGAGPYGWAATWRSKDRPPAPWSLRLLGEQGVDSIWLDIGMPAETRADYQTRLEGLFPEAQVIEPMEKWNQYHPPFSTPPKTAAH